LSVRRFIPSSGIVTFTMMIKALFHPTVFGATAIAEDGQGRVLLVRQSYAQGWRLPGGGVNKGEPPELAVVRELEEEVGLVESTAPEFIGVYSRKVAWFTNVNALYRLRNVRLQFQPNLEIREVLFCDPATPPDGTTPATRRRLAELTGKAPRSPYW
jgi:ADP-ribose pyrophosphatase YjhB (NUDIX family)